MSIRPLVLGAVRGYGAARLSPFVRSLRETGYAGEALLLDFGGLDPAARRLLAAHGVELVRPPEPHWLDAAVYPVAPARFLAFRWLLAEQGHRWDRVLLADVGDVIFQADPFAAEAGPGLSLFLAGGRRTLGGDPAIARFLAERCSPGALDKLGPRPLSPAGAVLGETGAVARYCARLGAQLEGLRRQGPLPERAEQAIHNLLLWTRQLDEVTLFPNGLGNVISLGGLTGDELARDGQGRVRNDDGTLPAVVHQHDRVALEEPLAARWSAPPEVATPAPGTPAPAPQPAPGAALRISVIVPTFDRPDRVAALLGRLREQTLDPSRFEVIFVDDGSPEPIRADPAAFPFALRVLRQPNQGPAAARNLGAACASAPLVIFLNDDAIPRADLLAVHLEEHARAGGPVAVMGSFPFTERSLREPFTRLLDRTSLLFDFPGLRDRGLHDWTFFWTCNISLSKALFERAGGFDGATFKEAIVEDVELGYRLEKLGVKTLYRQDAVCEHEHPLTADGYFRRALRLGVNLAKMYRKHRDARVLWQPAGRELGHDYLMALQLHVEAKHAESEQFLEALRVWVERTRGKEIPAAEKAELEGRIRHHALVPLLRGVLLELAGADPVGAITAGPARGKLTSIIACSYNALEKTRNCLAALRRHAEPGFPTEILFVDNGSTDGSAEWLAAQPDVTLIRNADNQGAPLARNQAIPLAKGDAIVFIDNDVVVGPEWLSRLRWHAEVDPLAACVGACADRASHGQEVPWEGPYDAASIDAFAAAHAGRNHRRAKGAATLASFLMLVKRSAVERFGGFDGRFSPWGFEDDDYTVRAFFGGLHNRIALDVFVHHDTYAGPKLERHTRLLHQNWKRFLAKWKLPDAPYGHPVDLEQARGRGWTDAELFVPWAAGASEQAA